MVNNGGLCSPLSLGAFARIVHNEGVEMWHWPQNGVWKALLGKRDALTRQPLEITVFANMDDRMDRRLQ